MKMKSSFAGSRLLTGSLVVLFLAFAPLAQGTTETVLHNNGSGSDGQFPMSNLILDSAGNLYGTTENGGTGPCSAGCGTVFQLIRNGEAFTESVVYNFQGAASDDGANPRGALTADAAGNLYGVTTFGGHFNCGTVFKLTSGSGGSWKESILHSFCADGTTSDGDWPNGNLVFDASGNLYGVAQYGGTHHAGVVFELTPSSGTWTETVLYSFSGGPGDGSQPVGIIFDSAGNLDGVTAFGGAKFVAGAGVAFQLIRNPPGQWTEHLIHRFNTFGPNVQTPTGGLIFDALGNLYMTMGRGRNGGAGVFELIPGNGGSFTARELHSFPGLPLSAPQSYQGLVFNSAGDLYSASEVGRKGCRRSACGFIYKLSPGSSRWTATHVVVMNGSNGENPIGGVTLDTSGNLYGVAYRGGTNKKGVVFRITP